MKYFKENKKAALKPPLILDVVFYYTMRLAPNQTLV